MNKADKIDISEMKLPKAEISVEDLTQFSNDKCDMVDTAIKRECGFKLLELSMLITLITLCMILKEYIGITRAMIIVLVIATIHIIVSTWLYKKGTTPDNVYKLRNDILYINYILNKDKERIYTVDASNDGTFVIYETSEWSKNSLILMEFRLLKGNKPVIKVEGNDDGDIIHIVTYSDSIDIIKSKKVEYNE